MSGHRVVQSCGSLLKSYGEDVVVELCVGAEPSRERIVERIDNRICDIIAGQKRQREQHFSLGIYLRDLKAKACHKHVSRRIRADLSSCRDRCNPDLSAGAMDFRNLNRVWLAEINGVASQ